MSNDEIVSVVRVDIIRPIGAEWDEVGPVLRTIMWSANRVMNVVMRELYLYDRSGTKTDADAHPQTMSYRWANEQVERERQADPSFSVSSKVVLAWATHAYKAYGAAKKAVVRGDQSLPSYRRGSPIMMVKAGWGLERDGKGYVLDVGLRAGRGQRVRLAVAANGPKDHALLRALVSGGEEVRRGDMKIVYEDKDRSWSARLTTIRARPPVPALDRERKFAVHRGMRTLFTWATSDGMTGMLDDGGQAKAFKMQMARRRRAWMAHKRNPPARVQGHGRWRFFEQERELRDIEARWMDTHLKQYAAKVVKSAVQRGCGTIVLDDWSARDLALSADSDGKEYLAAAVRNWPFAAQKSAIERAADIAGVAVETVKSAWESVTCPACQNVDSSQSVGNGRFLCANPKCGIGRRVDEVAAWNQLSAAGASSAFETNQKKRKAVQASVKQAIASRASAPPPGE